MILSQNLEAPYRCWPFLTSVLSVSFVRGARPACPEPLGDPIGLLNSFSALAASALQGTRRACPPSYGRAFRSSLCFPVSPLEATLTKHSASVHSKRLTQTLSLLEATLTKNREEGIYPPTGSAYPPWHAISLSSAELSWRGEFAVQQKLVGRPKMGYKRS
jgi:hypothetical protein